MNSYLTILTAASDVALTKRLSLGAAGEIIKTPSVMPRRFRAECVPVETIYDLARVLTWLEGEKDRMVIRGEPVPGLNLSRPMRRLKYDDGETKATLRSSERGKTWICLDFDKIPTPDFVARANDPDWGFLYLTRLLPEEFHDVTFWAQWSSSAGVGGWDTLSAHLWFMLDRPVTDDDLRDWAERCGAPIDRSLFNAVQPHFTASPIISTGLVDPCPRRHALVEGVHDTVSINLSGDMHDRRGIARGAREAWAYSARIGHDA